jgi:hypothetical protein
MKDFLTYAVIMASSCFIAAALIGITALPSESRKLSKWKDFTSVFAAIAFAFIVLSYTIIKVKGIFALLYYLCSVTFAGLIIIVLSYGICRHEDRGSFGLANFVYLGLLASSLIGVNLLFIIYRGH